MHTNGRTCLEINILARINKWKRKQLTGSWWMVRSYNEGNKFPVTYGVEEVAFDR